MARRLFGPADRAVVVKALAGGATVRGAAKAAGFCPFTLYAHRRTCALFREAWEAAVAESARPVLVTPGPRRRWQIRRQRANAFTRERKEIWLETFAATCDVSAACAAAEISANTAYRHLKTDPAFRDARDEALGDGYVRLEAEALAQRLAAMERLKVRMRESGAEGDADAAAEFERAMRLLTAFHKTKAGRNGGAPPTKWSFDEAFGALERRLQAFGLRVGRGEKAPEEEVAPPPPCRRSPSPRNRGEEHEEG